MKKLIFLLVFLGTFATQKTMAQIELNPTLDYIYKTTAFKIVLRFDINDQLQSVYFMSGTKWLEYEIVKDEYMGDGKGWEYTIQDGISNKFMIVRPSLEGNVVIKDANGQSLELKRVKY